MAKLVRLNRDNPKPGHHTHIFYCPGCDQCHGIDDRRWTVTGTPDNPTLRASILIPYVPPYETYPARPQCHSFITDGRIEYLSDSTHALAGQTVDLPDQADW